MSLEERVLAQIELGGGVSKDSLLVQHVRAESHKHYLAHRKAVKAILRNLRQTKKIDIQEGSYFYPTEVSHD